MIIPDKKTFEFIRNNMNQDVSKLLLKASKHPDFDIPFIADQIISLRNIKDKLPEWYQKEEITIPSRISSEQCSSELTAKYKQSLFDGGIICDLTGGLGVDSYYFAQKSEKSFYIERFEEYCLAARHNFKTLGADNIEVINADSREAISMLPEHLDCFYIDPVN